MGAVGPSEVHAASDPQGDPWQVDVAGTRRLAQVVDRDRLRHLVYVSIVGPDREGAKAALAALTHAAGFLRGEVTRRLSLRRAPELRFIHDRGAEQAELLEKLLKEPP